MKAYQPIPEAGVNPIPENGKLVIGDLVVGNVRCYFDESGSYMNHLEAQASREPTADEMDWLSDYGIVCVSSVAGSAEIPEQDSMPYTNFHGASDVMPTDGGAVPYKTDLLTVIILCIGVVLAIPVLFMVFGAKYRNQISCLKPLFNAPNATRCGQGARCSMMHALSVKVKS